jgi:glycosyltransferase involved in cell wall biosynthesis
MRATFPDPFAEASMPQTRSATMTSTAGQPRVAVLVPCYNEEQTVGRVVADFRRVLPGATVYVFDNASTDATAAAAREAGAIVVREKRRGKGNVIAAMFTKVDADFYVMVDGDDTYPADAAPTLLEPLFREEADMVVGQRLSTFATGSFRPLHVFGNKLVRSSINAIFGTRLRDIMSGYRAFTREVAQSIPVVASGFDVETEMTLQLLYRRFVLREIPVAYRARPEGSFSKLNTFRDGALVLLKILGVLKAYKPLTFFGSLAIVAVVAGLAVGYFPIREYVTDRYVYSVPKAILAASLMILATLLAAMGVLLHTLNFRILEMTNILGRQTRAGGAPYRAGMPNGSPPADAQDVSDTSGTST